MRVDVQKNMKLSVRPRLVLQYDLTTKLGDRKVHMCQRKVNPGKQIL
jgi:hypothetical protein